MRLIPMRFCVRIAVFALAGWLSANTGARALELVMFERDGCGWCERWNRNVAPAYDKTDEGKRAPLRRVDIDRKDDPGFALDKPIRYTPTFVVVDGGREVGRVTGYLSDDAFWSLLGQILAKTKKPEI